MARIDSGPLEADMPASLVPRESWKELLRLRMWFVKVKLPYDCRNLVQFVDEAGEMYEALGFKNSKDLIQRGLELSPKEIKHALAWLRITKPEHPVSLKDATILGKHGGDRKSKNVMKQGNNVTLVRGNHAAYGLARLDRDRPDLAAKVRTGKLSVHAASIEAGFRKAPTGLDLLRKAWKKATDSEQRIFLREVSS